MYGTVRSINSEVFSVSICFGDFGGSEALKPGRLDFTLYRERSGETQERIGETNRNSRGEVTKEALIGNEFPTK